uniref:Uncharacterized protein n=1 Tax=Glossina austeni TaxID=7395 RepID=A0A1A9VFK6_GLOAU
MVFGGLNFVPQDDSMSEHTGDIGDVRNTISIRFGDNSAPQLSVTFILWPDCVVKESKYLKNCFAPHPRPTYASLQGIKSVTFFAMLAASSACLVTITAATSSTPHNFSLLRNLEALFTAGSCCNSPVLKTYASQIITDYSCTFLA